jgi:hypothetical protein
MEPGSLRRADEEPRVGAEKPADPVQLSKLVRPPLSFVRGEHDFVLEPLHGREEAVEAISNGEVPNDQSLGEDPNISQAGLFKKPG